MQVTLFNKILGVIVTVAVIGDVELFNAVKPGILLVEPLVGVIPIVELFIFQTYVAPVTLEVRILEETTVWGQTVMLDKLSTWGVGLIVIVKLIGFPLQLLATGVTVMLAIMALLPGLIVVNAGIFPVPLAPNPIFALEFVQLYWVPATIGLLV